MRSKRSRVRFREIRPAKGKLCPFLLFCTNMWLLIEGLVGHNTQLGLVLIVLALDPILFHESSRLVPKGQSGRHSESMSQARCGT